MSKMTQITIPYGEGTVQFELPEENLLGIYAPHPVPAVPDPQRELEHALANPIDAPTLAEIARGKKRVVLVADDGTRPTPTAAIIPLLLNILNKAGVPDDGIEVLIALGTHRPMAAEEIEIKFGAEVLRRVRVTNHEPFDPKALVDVGMTSGGERVQVNRKVMEADLVVGIGSIVPHHIPGFSGGAKIIQPGVCGAETTGHVHLLSIRRERSLLGVLENEVRAEMEQIAARAGLRAILNTVLNSAGELVRAVYGDPQRAFRQGVETSRQIYGVAVPEQVEIVVASSHPCDSEFWQAHKTLYTAQRALREGGTMIVAAPCPEGVAMSHPEIVHFAGQEPEAIEAMIRTGQIPDLTAGALALAWANTRKHARVALVAQGIPNEEARALGFVPFGSVQEALDEALARHSKGARVSVLPFAPDTLPIIA